MTRSFVLFATAGTVLCSPPIYGQGPTSLTWVPVAGGPPAKATHCMAYDSGARRVVLFGGFDNQTWVWDGAWHELNLQGPPTRMDADLVYDTVRGKFVLFGGWGPSPVFGDTWEWDGGSTSSWQQRQVQGPPARRAHSMAYDQRNEQTVLFGGRDGVGPPMGDAWTWDGSEWGPMKFTGPTPSARADHAMVYDTDGGRIVLFGGWDGSQALGDTWSLCDGRWTLIPTPPPPGAPAARWNHALAYDSGRGMAVLFGGADDPFSMGDTWGLRGNTWTLLNAAGPSPRRAHAMVFDRERLTMVMFGGSGPLSDTWLWQRCYSDCNGDGVLNLADFGCFQTRFAIGCPH